MGQTDILTGVFALYGTDVTFYHAFLPYMGPTDILTCVFVLYGTDGHFKMRFCLIWDRRTF